jgi:hypothetical protein
MPVSHSSTETYVSDHDVGDARDEQMPWSIADIDRACYSTLEKVGVSRICGWGIDVLLRNILVSMLYTYTV